MFALAQLMLWPRADWPAMGGREQEFHFEFTPLVHPWPLFLLPPLRSLSFHHFLIPFSTCFSIFHCVSVFSLFCNWFMVIYFCKIHGDDPIFSYILPLFLFRSFHYRNICEMVKSTSIGLLRWGLYLTVFYAEWSMLGLHQVECISCICEFTLTPGESCNLI